MEEGFAQNRLSQSEISMLLDVYMYTDYKYAKDGMTLKEIVKDMELRIDVNEKYYKEYTILKDAVKNPQVGNLQIGFQAREMGYNEGTNAVTFVNPKENNIYVIFRGTADGEWPDNGLGMTAESTLQQREALNYFDEVVSKITIGKNTSLFVSGHSKGGNKVQYITMESKNSDLIDACYSVDGQGHSEASVNRWKKKYSKEEYDKRVSKIYAINGENDFVSTLGCSLLLASNISYIKTEGDIYEFAKYHDITAMFAKRRYDNEGNYSIIYSSKKNSYALHRGIFGNYVKSLSDKIMELPPDKRDGCAATLMHSIERLNEGKVNGLNGEKLTFRDIYEYLAWGIPAINDSFKKGIEGKLMINALLNSDSFDFRMNPMINVRVHYMVLREVGLDYLNKAYELKKMTEEISKEGGEIPLYYKGYSFRKPHIDNSVVKIKDITAKIERLANKKLEAAKIYKDFDKKSESIAANQSL